MKKNFTRWFLGVLLCITGVNAWALTQVGGVYQIATAQDLADFATLVNGGDKWANAVLTADVDYTDQTATIGTVDCYFYGTLDGQGHTVTVALKGAQAGCGLVTYAAGAIRNLHVAGTIQSDFQHIGGIAGYTYGALIENCISTATITSGYNGDATCGGIVGLSQAGSTIRNCVFAGVIEGDNAQNCAGILGWASGATTIQNSLHIGEMDIVMSASTYNITRNPANVTLVHCYAKAGIKDLGGTANTGVVELTDEQIASGEAAFLLGMNQKLPGGAYPTPLGTDKVYATTTACDGTGATAFTNDPAGNHAVAHAFDGYKCSECGALDEHFMTPEDGVYKVSTAEQLAWVAEMTNAGHASMDVQLTADIDLAGYEEWPMIGLTKYPYRGHFDGKHHVISNLQINSPKGVGIGLFGSIASPVVVENLTLDETCSILGLQHVGMIGHSQGAGFITLNGLGNRGTVAAPAVTDGGNGDAGIGGIIGNCPQGARGTIDNCWFTGNIPSGTSAAFISGWVGSNQFTLNGCWSIAEGTSSVKANTCIARAGSSGKAAVFNSCASVYGTQVTTITADAAASGELCFIINGKQSENVAWHQTLNTDPLPTLTGSSVVYIVGTKNCDGTAAEGLGYANEDKGFIQNPHEMDPSTGLCTNCHTPELAEDGYYLISSATGLRWVADKFNNGEVQSMNFRLTADIDLAGDNWTPIGMDDDHPFNGNMDGGQHTISNMTVSDVSNAGLFGTVFQGNLSNVLIDATCSVQGSMYAGGLIGHTKGSYTVNITNVGTMCPVSCTGGTNAAAAGIIGNANAGNITNITRCFTTGAINSTSDAACISGWQGNVGSKITDCWTVSEITKGKSNFARGGVNTTVLNCYCAQEYTEGIKANFIGVINVDMLATGELCYIVNGNSSDNPAWYQTLDGTDATPVPWSNHKVVYAVGALNCDGTSAGGDLTYSNENTSEIPPHDEDCGVCSNCGAVNKEYKTPVNGFYELETAGDVVWFSLMVDKFDNTLNARLIDDIDFTGYNDTFVPLGSASKGYSGTFDGQNHRVSNLDVNVNSDDAGFISSSNSGMTLKNIVFDETCSISTTGKYAGVVGASNWSQAGTTTFTNVGMEGDVSCGGNNAGAILGGNHGSQSIIVMKQCYATGTVTGVSESAGLAGWIGSRSESTIESCWIATQVDGQDGTKEAYRGTASVKNCFSTTGGQFTKIEKSEIASGELAWKLNGKAFVNPSWYQALGDDPYPTWMPTGIVYVTDKGFKSVYDEDTYIEFRNYTTSSEIEALNVMVANADAIATYKTALEKMEELDTMNEFLKAYRSAAAARNAVLTSKGLYDAYNEQSKYALEYINSNPFECVEAETLSRYLTEQVDPGDEYANGSYPYIMATHVLDNEAITAETDYVRSLLAAAIAADYQPGADITDLMVNASLDEGKAGWDIKSSMSGYPRILSVEDVMSAGEFWNCTFSMTQTIKGLKPGVYMLKSNATFRPGATGTSNFHSGYVVLGNNMNYAATEREDAISVADAIDGENCHITSTNGDQDYTIETDEGSCYIPQGPVGCAYAFKGNRYQNYVAVQIEEGDSLVIGVENQGTGMNRDWLGFGNFHLTYLGTADQGAEQLRDVLQNYLDRANTIAEFEPSAGVDYKLYPNYSRDLQDDLEGAITAAQTAIQGNDGAQMLELIDRFSTIFKGVYECRVAYIDMAKAADDALNLVTNFKEKNVITDAEYDDIMKMTEAMWDAYTLGTYSAEEARTKAEGARNLNIFLEQNDGYFLIASERDLSLFSAMVNSGMTDAKAQLTADIDMTGVKNFQPIGYNEDADNSTATEADKVLFNGVFDGQGHHISNLVIDKPVSVGVGLFGSITTPAEIRNFTLDASCSITGKDRVGVIGRGANSGAVKLDCLGNEGTIVATYQAGAGIMGNANSGCIANITNCYSSGSISSGEGKNSAQICGWLGSVGARITNCWSTAEITGYDSEANLFCRLSDNVKFTNCFSNIGDQVAVLTADDFASGSVAWILNGESTESPVWYQKLGTDLHPVFDASHEVVVRNADGTYANVSGVGVSGVQESGSQIVNVYDIQGRLIHSAQPASAIKRLPQGMYIIKGANSSRKVMVK